MAKHLCFSRLAKLSFIQNPAWSRLTLTGVLIGGFTFFACGGEESTGPGQQQAPSPTQLAFTVQPTDASADVPVSPAVQVAIRDASGSVVTSATDAVTVMIGTNPAAGTLSGTTTVNAVAGVASFTDLTIDQAGTGYTLVANSGSLTSATSAAFDILDFTPPPAANVNVGDNFFDPSSLTVSTGTTVDWTWTGANPHTVTFNDGIGNSIQQTSGTHMRQFTAVGTFGYFCTVHGASVMSGTVVVQ